MVAQRGQLLIGGQSSQVPQTLLGRVQAVSGRGLDEPAEDRLQRLFGEHVQDLDSERGRKRETLTLVLTPYTKPNCVSTEIKPGG